MCTLDISLWGIVWEWNPSNTIVRLNGGINKKWELLWDLSMKNKRFHQQKMDLCSLTTKSRNLMKKVRDSTGIHWMFARI